MKRRNSTRTQEIKKPKADEESLINDADIICLDDSEPDNEEMEEKDMTNKQRKEYLRKNIRKVEYEGYEDYKKAKRTAERKTEKDKLLQRRDNRQPTRQCDEELVEAQAYKAIFQIESTLNPGKNFKTDLHPMHKEKANKTTQELVETLGKEKDVPQNRILITSDITLTNNPVPVYCDLGKPLRETDIPDTFIFNYITENICNMNVHEDMKKFYAESQKSKNKVSCDCNDVDEKDTKGVICRCGPNCPCVIVNKKLQKKQNLDKYRLNPTKIDSSSKLEISDFDDYYDTFGFQCSEACKCKGRCNNNALYILKQNVHQLELFRSGPKGFGIRTRTFIPAYTPVLEFIGEISSPESISETKSEDYSLLLHHKDDSIIKLLKRHTGKQFSKKFLSLMESVWKEGPEDGVEYFINPKQKGNLGRFFSHSCLPNLAQVRIFTRSFTPADMKIVLVSTQDIYPGEELTFSYGPAYVRDHLDGRCLCGTIPCPANKNFGTFKNANFAAYCKYFQERHHEKFLKFKRYVIDEDKYIAPRVEIEYEEGSDSEAENVSEDDGYYYKKDVEFEESEDEVEVVR